MRFSIMVGTAFDTLARIYCSARILYVQATLTVMGSLASGKHRACFLGVVTIPFKPYSKYLPPYRNQHQSGGTGLRC
uniref:hypothetical protein n=1 Tax=Halomonas sp. TaxID=1486246 RepID=UPI0026220327|nr:hypothetical protein [Halomonas sp.]